MVIIKIILLVGFIIVVVKVALRLYALLQVFNKVKNAFRPDSKDKPESQKMSRCAACGLYIPEKEAIIYSNQAFCCHDHARGKYKDPNP